MDLAASVKGGAGCCDFQSSYIEHSSTCTVSQVLENADTWSNLSFHQNWHCGLTGGLCFNCNYQVTALLDSKYECYKVQCGTRTPLFLEHEDMSVQFFVSACVLVGSPPLLLGRFRSAPLVLGCEMHPEIFFCSLFLD